MVTPIAPQLIGLTGQLVVLGVGLKTLEVIDKTGKELNKNLKRGRITNL